MLACVPYRGVLLRVLEAIDSTLFDGPGYQDNYPSVLFCLFEMKRGDSPCRTAASVNTP